MPSHPFKEAIERRDIEGLLATLAPDVVFRSPLISEHFRGREQVGELLRLLADALLFEDGFSYTEEAREGDVLFLALRMRLEQGEEVEGVDILRLDADDKVREITVFLRPLRGGAAVAAILSPRIAATEGRASALMARFGSLPLLGMTRTIDRVAGRMVRRGAPRSR